MTTTTPEPIGPQVTDQPLVVRQGATYRARYRWEEGGVPQSLEGYSARLAIARRQNKPPIVEIHSSAGEILLEPEHIDPDVPANRVGWIEFFIPPSKTQLLRKATAWYDLVLIDDSDSTEVIRLLEGAVTVDLMTTPTGVPEA